MVVALVQPDRRLVEHVEHADQAGADLGGQPDALRLAAGQRGRGAVEREVVQPDVDEEAEPGVDLLEHPLADQLLAVGRGRSVAQPVGARRRSTARDTSAIERPSHGDGEDLGLEPGALAGRARHLAHEALVLLARVVALGLGVAALDPRHDALVVGVVGAVAAVAVAVADVHLLAGAVQHRLLRPRRQPLPRACRGRSPTASADALQQPQEVLAGLPGRPRRDRAARAAICSGRGRRARGRPPCGCRGRCRPGRRRTAS